MNPRFHCAVSIAASTELTLPAGAARHVQVLRMQPGDALTLFDGSGGEFAATVLRMGRSEVAVRVGAHAAIEREAPRAVHLAVGMPANDRMDWMVEKATELGVASIQPLVTMRGVLRLNGERAEKKRAHWEAISIAACEQCGRNRLPLVRSVQPLPIWLEALRGDARRFVLSLSGNTRPLALFRDEGSNAPTQEVLMLSGPEGGLSPSEQHDAIGHGFEPVTLGPRVLRAETAALAALALLAAQ